MKSKLCIFMFVLLLFIFQDYLQRIFPPFYYVDEVISCLFIPILIFQAITTTTLKVPKIVIYLLPLMLGICLLGLFSYVVYKYQPLKCVFEDLTIVFKFIFAFVSAKLIFSGFDLSKNEGKINFLARLLTIIFFSMMLGNLIWKFLPSTEIRFGIGAQKLWYSHPTYLASASVLLISLLTLFYNKYKANAIYIVLLSLVILSTLRFKAIAFVLCYFLIVIYFKFFKGRSMKLILLILCLLAFFVGFGQIKNQVFSNDSYARAVLYKYSIIIANDHFPLGSGFGTYGCITSAKNYSPVYYKYNIDKIYGLTKTHYNFICDTYWPMVIGQFGYFGLVIFCLIIYTFIKIIWSKKSLDPYYFLAAFSLILYLLITSTSETSFANYYAVHYFFVIGVIIYSLESKQANQELAKQIRPNERVR